MISEDESSKKAIPPYPDADEFKRVVPDPRITLTDETSCIVPPKLLA